MRLFCFFFLKTVYIPHKEVVMPHLIASRYSRYEEFTNLIPLKIGMCIGARVDDNSEPIDKYNTPLPYIDFVYIVGDIKEDKIIIIDTAHNNQWTLKPSELANCELIGDFHAQYDNIDCEYINRALKGFYLLPD